MSVSRWPWRIGGGAVMVACFVAAGVLFVGSLVVGWLWLRSAYTGPTEPGAFFTWLGDPEHRKDMEPLLAMAGLLLSPLLAVASALYGRLKKDTTEADVPKEGAAASAVNPEWQRIRGDLIKTVRSHWIDDYLRQSIYGRVRLKLGADRAPEAIARPFTLERLSGGHAEVLTNPSLLRLFEESGGFLLILGDPGAGKTVTLVQLAELLLERAQEDPEVPVPVIAPLASWALDQKPLQDWLSAELARYYGLSAKSTPELLREGKRLTLLLDGLDEVREGTRAACIAAIQNFRTEFAGDVVVCCRTTEYGQQPGKFELGKAIRIRPLTPGQVDAYLDALGRQFDGFRNVLRDDAALRELVATPLMLNILAVVYGSDESLPSESPVSWSDAVCTRYVRIAFERKEGNAEAGKLVANASRIRNARAIHWLQQIARCLVRTDQTTLHLERLSHPWVDGRATYSAVRAIAHATTLAVTMGVVHLATGRPSYMQGGLFALLVLALFATFGPPDIEPVETLRFRFKWRPVLHKFRDGLLAALLVASLLWGLTAATRTIALANRVLTNTLTPLLLASILLSSVIELRSHPEPALPNQGIHNSARIGLIAMLGFGLFGFFMAWVTDQEVPGRLAMGFGAAWIGFASFGGMSLLDHYILRLYLAYEKTLPFPLSDKRLVVFLDAMRDRILLTRVGGGWVFIHRLLLDFLAREPFGATPADVERKLEELSIRKATKLAAE